MDDGNSFQGPSRTLRSISRPLLRRLFSVRFSVFQYPLLAAYDSASQTKQRTSQLVALRASAFRQYLWFQIPVLLVVNELLVIAVQLIHERVEYKLINQ